MMLLFPLPPTEQFDFSNRLVAERLNNDNQWLNEG